MAGSVAIADAVAIGEAGCPRETVPWRVAPAAVGEALATGLAVALVAAPSSLLHRR